MVNNNFLQSQMYKLSLMFNRKIFSFTFDSEVVDFIMILFGTECDYYNSLKVRDTSQFIDLTRKNIKYQI